MDHPIRIVAAALLAGVLAGRCAPFPPALVAAAAVCVAVAVVAFAAAGAAGANGANGANGAMWPTWTTRARIPSRAVWGVVTGVLALGAGCVLGTPGPAPSPPPSAEVAWVEGIVRTAPPGELPAAPDSRRGDPQRGDPHRADPRGSRPGDAPRATEDERPEETSGDDGPAEAPSAPRGPFRPSPAPTHDIAFDIRLPSGVAARVGLEVRSTDEIPDLLPGDGVRILGRVRPRAPPSNPGAVVSADPAGAPLRVDIDAAGPEAIQRVPQTLGAGDAVRRVGERLRRVLVARIRAACGDGLGASLLICALTGDRTTLPRDVARAFRDSGTAHLLAVSGLHLVLLTSVLGGAARRCVPETLARRFAVPATLAVVLMFSAACRFEVPVVRAAAFVVTRAVAHAVRRRSDPVDQLALAAVFVVAWEPTQVFDPGFQLSFVAVAGLILLTRRLRDALFPNVALMLKFRSTVPRRRLRVMLWASSAIPATVAAQCATAPVVAATFGTAQPSGFVANLFAVPAFAVLLPLAAVLAALGGHGEFLARPSDLAAGAVVTSLEAVAAMPGATLALGRPPPWSVLLSSALLVASLAFRVWSRRHLLLPAASFAALALPAMLRQPATEVIVLDVGHGLCVLVRSENGDAILYDAGGRATSIGDRVIVPALRELGMRRLDALFLSHEDSDHTVAAEDVLRTFDVGEVVVPVGFGDSPLGVSALRLCAERGVPVTALARGDRWAAGEIAADVLSPVEAGPVGAENSDSLVVRLVAGRGKGVVSILLTGDIETEALDALVGTEIAPTDVLVLPHHGRAGFEAQVLLAERCGATTLIASASDDESRLPPGAWSTAVRGAIRVRPGRTAEAWPWKEER